MASNKYSINDTDVAFKLFGNNSVNTIFLRDFKFKDLISSEMTMSDGESELILTLQFEEGVDEILDYLNDYYLTIERMTFSHSEVNENNVNQYYFISNVTKSISGKDGSITESYILTGKRFREEIEFYKTCLHTYYTPLPFPEELPADFNNVYFSNKSYEFIMNKIYQDNIILPFEITRGTQPTINNFERSVNGLIGISIESFASPSISFSTEETSIFEIRDRVESQIPLNLKPKTQVKNFYSEIDGWNFEVLLKQPTTHILNYLGGDRVVSFKEEYDSENFYNSITITNSDEKVELVRTYDDRGTFGIPTQIYTPKITTREKFESTDVANDNPDKINFYNNAGSKAIIESRATHISSIEIEIVTKKYLKEVNQGDLIRLVGFDFINESKLFRINKMKEVIDNSSNYPTYFLEELEEVI